MEEIHLENGKTFTISKLPLGKYADLLQAFQELPKHFDEFKEFKSFTNEQFFVIIPKLIGSCMPDIIRVITIATELTEDEVQALGITEVIDIILAIYKVNNYQAVLEKIKKAVTRPVQMQQPVVAENLTPTN